MKIKLLFLLFLATFTTHARYTLIPDPNFEQKLIDLEIDTDGLNGKVLTSSISTLTYLDVSESSIKSLTGIEDFVALTILYCYVNQLTVLDISKNLALIRLNCSTNQLTNLDVSKNIALEDFVCAENQLTTLDISKNVVLTYLNCALNQLTYLDISKNVVLADLFCFKNRITHLDVSKNLALVSLFCSNNRITELLFSKNETLVFFDCNDNQISYLDVSKNAALIVAFCSYNRLASLDFSKNEALKDFNCSTNNLYYLNLKNGKNTLLNSDIKMSKNPNLTCIQVDDVTYSNNNWTGAKDAIASYSETCTLALEDSEFNKAVVYPNPTKGEVNILNIALEKATVYNVLGQLVKTFVLDSANTNNTINLSGLPKGVYFVYLINQDAASVKKIIVE